MKENGGDLLIKPIKNNRFKFRCHKDIECFTKCCGKLNLILTPYDIIRLKNRLNISSDVFLEDYTETRFDNRSRFPMVYLKMREDKDRRCPFVAHDGCTIYKDRPGACRIYPLGRAAAKTDGKRDATERFFIVSEKHCMGFNEDKEWTIEEWIGNEGVSEYNALNDKWMEIITSSENLGQSKDLTRKIQMFNMASYNLDKFREFLFGSRFFDLFDIDSDLIERIESDDRELMLFAFRWLRFSLFGEKTLEMKSTGRHAQL